MTRYNTQDHFDEIASGYHEEISSHIRDHLINKWWAIVSPYFKEGAMRKIAAHYVLTLKK